MPIRLDQLWALARRIGIYYSYLQLQRQKLQSHEQVPKPEGVSAASPQIMQKRKLPPLFHLRRCRGRTPLPELCICTWRVQGGAGSRSVADVVAAGSVNFGLGVLWPVSPTALQANDTVAHCSGITESLPLLFICISISSLSSASSYPSIVSWLYM